MENLGVLMNQDRLNVHYETLYRIIEQRYNGITPESIKSSCINSEIEFKIDESKKGSSKTIEEKREDYIYAEVGRALQVLAKKAKSAEEIEDNEDTYDFYDEDVDEKQREDYKYYPNSLVVGEPKKLNNNKVSKRNATYRLNKNIKFSITDREELRISSKFLYMLFDVEKEHNINDEMVYFLTKKKETTPEFKGFSRLIDTFIQINTQEVYMPNKHYTLDFLLTLITLGASININIQSKKSIFSLNNIVINELLFDKNKFDIVCDGINITINDIQDIKLIESATTKNIHDNISELQDILSEYPDKIQKGFNGLIENYKGICQIFFQD
jgi:hypothetical protein